MLILLLSMVTLFTGEMPVEVSDRGKSLIEKHEGRRDEVYVCPGGKNTVGVGHALTGDDKILYPLNSKVNDIMIDVWFDKDLAKAAKTVNNWVTKPLNQNQFDALVSFVFNVGPDQFKRSTLLKMLNKGAYEKAANEFKRWIHSRGKKLPGLITRRAEEAKLFREEMAEDVVT